MVIFPSAPLGGSGAFAGRRRAVTDTRAAVNLGKQHGALGLILSRP